MLAHVEFSLGGAAIALIYINREELARVDRAAATRRQS
jgi:hypothetical protein